jgi:hypothetical protein
MPASLLELNAEALSIVTAGSPKLEAKEAG